MTSLFAPHRPWFAALSIALVACSGGSDDEGKGKGNGGNGGGGEDTAQVTDTAGSITDDTGPQTQITTDSGQVLRVDRFVQASPPAVDILFVIDDSCSMAPLQADLAAAFPMFMNYLLGSGIDYHIGVTSTSITSASSSCNFGTLRDGELVGFQGARWIDTDTVDPVFAFSTMAQLGDQGSGCEQGLGAAKLALDDRLGDVNAGFLREEAALHTIVVSDEEDQTENQVVTLQEFQSWYDGLKTDAEDRRFHSLVCTTTSSQGSYGAGCFQTSIGDRYMLVSDNMGGTIADIFDPHEDFVDDLGLLAAGLQRGFVLTETPVPESITVEVHSTTGAVFAFAEGKDWFYDAKGNQVTFLQYLPEPGDEVVISYAVQ